MDFLAKLCSKEQVCSEKQVNNVNNDSDGTRFPKSKEENNVVGTPQMNAPAVQDSYSADSCLNGSISMSSEQQYGAIMQTAREIRKFQRAEVRDQDVPISMSSEQQYGAIMQTAREIHKSQPVVTQASKDEQSLDFEYGPVKKRGTSYRHFSRCHPCEYVSTLSSGGGRCTRYIEGNKRYCSLHDDVTKRPAKRKKEESSTERPAKLKKEESSTERPAKRKKEEQHNCILCWEDTDNLSSDQIAKQQQERLLLLRHASVCTNPAGWCTVTPDCESMKSLWDHIMICKSQNCSTPHCVSSRYLLSHYKNCKEETCPVCGPYKTLVRKTIDKYSKEETLSYF